MASRHDLCHPHCHPYISIAIRSKYTNMYENEKIIMLYSVLGMPTHTLNMLPF